MVDVVVYEQDVGRFSVLCMFFFFHVLLYTVGVVCLNWSVKGVSG